MSTVEFPDKGILWQIWNDETLRVINEKQRPVLLFVRDTDPSVWPFLRDIFKEMPKNATLRTLLHESCIPLYTEVETLPEKLKQLGAGSGYHVAILSPTGLTPMITIDVTSGTPPEIVERIVALLQRVSAAWI